MSNLIHHNLSYQILGAAFAVHSTLGSGLLECLYQKAMCIELQRQNLNFICQAPYKVFYHGNEIGNYFADLVVENKILVELKAVKKLDDVMSAQTLNYMKIANLEVGYLINFKSISVVWKRFYHQRH